MKGAAILVYISCVLLIWMGSLVHSSSIEVVFYNIDMEEWNEEDGTNNFQHVISNTANSYCAQNLDACGLVNWMILAQFTRAEVKVVDGFPAKSKSNLVLKFTVMYNSQMNITDATQTDLSSQALRAIAVLARDQLRSLIGAWLIYIDNEHYSPPPTHRANEIIIPIAFAVLLLLIVLVISLHYWRKRKDSEEKRLAKKDRMSNRVSPSHQPPPYNQVNAKFQGKVYPPSRKSDGKLKTPSDNMTQGDKDTAENGDERKRHHKRRHHKRKKEQDPDVGREGQEAPPYMYQRFTGPGNGHVVDFQGHRSSGNEDARATTETTEL